MDKKSDRRLQLEVDRRHQNEKTHRYTAARVFKKYGQTFLTGGLLFVILLLLCSISSRLPDPFANQPPDGVTGVSYETFVNQIQTGNMRTVTIQGDGMMAVLARSLRGQACDAQSPIAIDNPWGITTSPSQVDPTCTIYVSAPAQSDAALLPSFLRHGVVINTKPAQPSLLWLPHLFLAIALVVMLLLFLNPSFWKNRLSSHSEDKLSQWLKSRARRVAGDAKRDQARPLPAMPPLIQPPAVAPVRPKSRVRFADVAGIDEARAELEEVVQFLRSPERFQRLGAHIPRGVLLVGPPGTGKTLLAKAVAGEADVPFFHMSASEFVEMFVGVGASRVRDLFQQARQSAPCVIFLDEIDAVGRRRSLRLTDSGERDQTLNQLLVELDGFESRSAVMVLAATNRADMLDAALLRPGRFDRRVTVTLPDRVGREAILRVHTRCTPLHPLVSLERLARLTTGMSGAELANLVNETALCAARRGLDSLTQTCFEEALERIQLGARRPLVLSEQERRIIAFHECGHALVAYYVPEADPVNFLTILPHGEHLGVTQFAPSEDRYNYNRAALMARIAVGLGGRVAVELAFGAEGVTTGAEDDLRMATALAWRMVTHWGMGKQVGVVFADYCEVGHAALGSQASARIEQPLQAASVPEKPSPPAPGKTAALDHACFGTLPRVRYVGSPSMAAIIDGEVQRIVDEGRTMAYLALSEHYSELTSLVDVLMEQEQLDRKQFEAILRE